MTISQDRELIIEIDSVSLERSGRVILDGINWGVTRGSIAALVGPNGSGKSTLVSVMGGYIWPSCGLVRVLGQRYGAIDLQELRKRIGIIETSRAPEFVHGLTVRDVVATGLFSAFMLLRKEEIGLEQWRQIDTELERLLLMDLCDQPWRKLSTGEKARTLIARAMVARPELLILDEPASGLDIAGRFRFVKLLETLHRRPDAPTMIIVTHHLDELPATTDSVALMKDGRIDFQGSASDTLTSMTMSQTFDCPIEVERQNGYYSARVMDNSAE